MRYKREIAAALGLAAATTYFTKRPRASMFTGLAWLGAGAVLLWPRTLAAFEGNSVVITGGSRGLGFELARQCLSQGAKVTLLARDPDELDSACKKLQADDRVFTVVCDVTDCKALDQAFAEARARFGTIDVLINDAGSILAAPFPTMKPEEFRAQLELHVVAIATAMNLARPYFHQAGGGRVINICSIGGLVPVPHLSSYSASKFALSGLSRAAAAELASEGISVLTAYPGLMRTGSAPQAVFKGDAAAEFAWFATLANTPGLSVSAPYAARAILAASADRRSEVIVSWVAKLAAAAVAVFPESVAFASALVARGLPSSSDRTRHSGAEFRAELNGPLARELSRTEEALNERALGDAERALGLH